ncbi:PREDICTED: uncharacterized protein At2g39795, mitochondrial-like [Nelumbo nucifera]|uniref:Uncharacterized protein At2g39795, mitochondrial-like n=1 Tax=Nelumbo nucifera TaxID=4432 RepID=A0A1U8AS43_NELNU|nr:PREDICTED: uncharacterized protein At2g39795, mitochondrial-like [Nelumbo nucifera]
MRSITYFLLRRTIRFSGAHTLKPKQHHFFSSLVSSFSSTISSSCMLPTKLSHNSLRSSLFLPFRFASTATKRIGADENLTRVLESEIECAENPVDDFQGGYLPDGFPFEIIDNPGEQTITLKREFSGESIQVEVHMPDMTGEEDDDNEDESNEDENDESSSQTNISLIVTIAKGEGPILEFSCTAYPDEITIDSMLMKNPEASSNQIAYEGPQFMDLDENLQKALYKYLEVRGIRSSLTNFLQEYMINKDNREYLGWLKNMKGFIEK